MELIIYFFVFLFIVFILFGKFINRKILIVGSICLFAISVISFIWFFYQSYVYSTQECNEIDGCMNEFGGFIIIPITLLIISILMYLCTFLIHTRQKQ